jgi:cytochrome P450
MIGDTSIREYMSHVAPGSRKDSLGQLIVARDENGIPLSEEELVAAGMVFMIVGTTRFEDVFDK